MWGERIILVHPVPEVFDPESADLVSASGLGLGLSMVVEVVLCWCLRGPYEPPHRAGLVVASSCRVVVGVGIMAAELCGCDVAVGMVDS